MLKDRNKLFQHSKSEGWAQDLSWILNSNLAISLGIGKF